VLFICRFFSPDTFSGKLGASHSSELDAIARVAQQEELGLIGVRLASEETHQKGREMRNDSLSDIFEKV